MKYLKGQNALVQHLEGDDNLDSDCDDDPTVTSNGTSKEEQGEEEERAVLARSFSACVHFLASSLRRGEQRVLQLEISLLLSLHRCDLVRPPQIPGCRLPPGSHPRTDNGGCTPSVFAEEHLRSGKFCEATLNWTSHA